MAQLKILVKNMATKKELRIKYKSLRGQLTPDMGRHLSEQICKQLMASSLYQQAEQLYFYYPLEREVDLLPLAKLALSQGKQIAFPRVNGAQMDFYQIFSLTEFAEGNFHVMEPLSQTQVRWERAVVLCPGLVFDRQGNRIGYGKAFYDRYLADNKKIIRLGIAYAFQVVDELKSESQDQKMQYLVTEQSVEKC